MRRVDAYREFREDAVKHKFRHFLEVFNPNAPQNLDPELMPFYVNDMIMRVLAGMAKVERPLFLKMPFNGRKAMEELASHDPGLVIGILGGSAGTTRDCFELLSQGEKTRRHASRSSAARSTWPKARSTSWRCSAR